MMRIVLNSLLLLLILGTTQPALAAPTCRELFQTRPLEVVEYKPGQRFNSDPKVFRQLADRIQDHRKEFFDLLSDVDNYHGAVYEITQVIRTLRGVELHELEYLKATGDIKHIAVYGSTNIPLYTLILHAVIPASTGAHIWFRTPMASRETYVRAMNKIREIMPDVDLSHIHLLTEPADVQYDNFRKQHVLGLNRKGTRSVRPPADMVIFTGSPQTGEEIRGTIAKKLEELKSQIPEVKTVFLQFGSGLNPVIVTDLASGAKLEPAVQASIQAIRINSSQDCIAPKFYMVHEKVAGKFVERVKSEVSRLKYGPRNDSQADYSSLTFAEGVDNLLAFRTKWSQYLVNPEAQIDPATKRVDPHVFVLPFEKFDEVELVDHYAPFIVMFKYSSKDQLEKVANDPRVKSRAMFASVFGDSANKEMVYLRKLFEDNFHSTILNQSVFVEESGNFAFGGYSEAASSATLFSRSAAQPELTTYTSSRPLLFSREARLFFGPTESKSRYAEIATTLDGKSDPTVLTRLIEDSKNLAATKHLTQDWSKLINPQVSVRPRGLKAIREMIAQSGFHRVVVGAAPKTDLIQHRVKIKKTDLGMPTEVRVDFIDGEAVHSRARYTHEYLGPELKEAEAVLNKFFAQAPPEIRQLSGGADIAKLEDGTWVFIEFNFGANSGTLSPELFPIESNLFLSRLTGRATPLIQQLEAAFSGGVATQRAYLQSLKEERDKWQKSSIKDMSKAETAKYFRGRYLDEWSKSPTQENADRTLAQLNAMIDGIGSRNNRDLPLLVLGARNFMNRGLMQRALADGGAAK